MNDIKRNSKDISRLEMNEGVGILINYALMTISSLTVMAIGDKRMKTRSVLR